MLAHQPRPLAAFAPFDLDLDEVPDGDTAFYRLMPWCEAVAFSAGHTLTVARALHRSGRLRAGQARPRLAPRYPNLDHLSPAPLVG
jgi:hypothetical protein